MKKSIVTFTAVLFFIAAFATGNVEKNIERSFQSEFPGATHVSWIKVDNSDLYAVRFVYGREAMMAYFDADGDYLAIVKSILEEDLPLQVKRSISRINPSGALATTEQISMMGETSYLVQFRERGHKKVYQIGEDGSIKLTRIKEVINSNR
ncbi:hypothetical protein [Lacibacter sediminis]|uniref:Beta-lactamase-inhibitor-like PepSY-like domain-containing protein n=1 Tax=Lacibacter sediminis TaxID=2760713 RepID=A0A7G5XH30_9BACT|nr:hypothetical protein [Lacibacter sediminis]QNA44783.1 hypothetical protein H4075_00880 [Lacibacter sediminis]